MASYLRKLSVNVFNSFKNTAPKLQVQNVARVVRKSTFSNRVNFSSQAVKKSASMDQRKTPKCITRKIENKTNRPGLYNIVALSTAKEYDLERLREGLKIQKLYDVTLIDNNKDVLHAVAKYKVETEPREIFFFREGSLVFWNIHEAESNDVVNFLKQYEQDSYEESLVISEKEFMNYAHRDEGESSTLKLDENFNVSIKPKDNLLEKYTFSNAMALSVKLGVSEAYLDKYIDSIKHIADDLSFGKKIMLNRANLLENLGNLLRMKTSINLKSDLLNSPDFYWNHEQFEPLYLNMGSYFSLSQRTQAINRKFDICNEVVEVLSRNLNQRYNTKLEWLIIILIAIEVVFETLNYSERHSRSTVPKKCLKIEPKEMFLLQLDVM